MNTRQQLITAAAVLLLSSVPALANEDNIAFDREVNACIAEVNGHADYERATRVRHSVVELKNTFSGYVLAIDTEVFTLSDEIAAREYLSHCVAKGDSKPRKFRIDEITG